MAGGFRPSLKTVNEGVTTEAEFLASEHAMAKRVGVTLDAATVSADGDGNKIVKKGTLVTKITATGKFGPYDGDASDGRETVSGDAGFTFETVNLADGDVVTGILIHGSVLEARVTGLDVSDVAKTALAGRIVFQ